MQATAVATIGVPGILLAHLLTTGDAAGPLAVAAVAVAVLAVAALLPARTTSGLALVTAATQLAGHTVLTLATAHGSTPDGCIPAIGRGASLGLRLALLEADATCPAGTLAPGPAAGVGAAALSAVLAAVTILAGHAAAAGLTGLLLTVARRAVGTGRRLRVLAGALTGLPARLALLLRAVRRPVRSAPIGTDVTRRSVVVPLTLQFHPIAAPLRGPPTAAHRVRHLAPA